MKKVLVYGYGNPGRQDDALANEFVDRIDSWINEKELEHITTDSNYQLNIEDAEIISHYDVVYFVDASIEDIKDVIVTKIEPDNAKVEFSMHAVSPAYVVDLCKKMYNKTPEAYLIHIKGYKWDFMDEITDKAKENLEMALSVGKYKFLSHSKEVV